MPVASNAEIAVAYHSPCNDGYAAFRVFQQVHPGIVGVPVRAGAPCAEIVIPPGITTVWVVDTNLSQEMVTAWRAQGVEKIHWLDHHLGNVPALEQAPTSIDGEVRRCEPHGPSAVIMACGQLGLNPGPFRWLISECDTHQFARHTKADCQAVYHHLRQLDDPGWVDYEAMSPEDLQRRIEHVWHEFEVFKRQVLDIPVTFATWLGDPAVVARVEDWLLVNPYVDRVRVVAPDAKYVLTYSDLPGGLRRWSVRSGSVPTGSCHTKCAEVGGGGHAEAGGFQTSHLHGAGLTL